MWSMSHLSCFVTDPTNTFLFSLNVNEALTLQLLQIDTKGCMRIIKERNLRQLELLKANARSPQQVLWF